MKGPHDFNTLEYFARERTKFFEIFHPQFLIWIEKTVLFGRVDPEFQRFARAL